MKKITCMLAGVSLLVIAGGVSAEPMTLSTTQMDGVNAGGVFIPQGAAIADAGAAAISNLLGLTASTGAVVVTPGAGFVGSAGASAAVAASSYTPGAITNGARADSIASSAATLF